MEGLDLGADALGFVDSLFAFNVDDDEIVGASVEEGEGFAEVAGGLDTEAGYTENLVAERTQNLALAQVQDGFLRRCFSRHGGPTALLWSRFESPGRPEIRAA